MSTVSGSSGRMPGMRWWWLVPLLPIAFAALLAAQALLATRGTYLPSDPGYQVAVTAGEDAPGRAMRVAVLGDSTVAGVGSPTADESLPVLIAERLADRTDRPVEVTGLGVSGARTRDVTADQVPRVADLDPDVVIAVVGSNDVTGVTSPWRLRSDIVDLHDEVDGVTDAPLVLAGIPRFYVEAFARPLRNVVDAYGTLLRGVQRETAADRGIGFVEIARDASPRFLGVDDAMSDDQFHPAPTGYGFWADAIVPTTVDALTQR